MGVTGAVLLLAGCGSSVTGDAGPVGKAAGEPVFSPCDDIPDDAVRAIGMDPVTEERDIMDVHQPGWNICGWNNDTHFVTVYATIYTLDDTRRNDDYASFVDLNFDDRPGMTFRKADERDGQRCYAAISSADGMVMVSASESGETPATAPLCDVAIGALRTVSPFVPE